MGKRVCVCCGRRRVRRGRRWLCDLCFESDGCGGRGEKFFTVSEVRRLDAWVKAARCGVLLAWESCDN